MPVEPPPKKEQLQKLLERGNVFLHLDPRIEGVVVPAGHAQRPQLVLQLGLHFAVPIPDLKIDDRGVRCTLSFIWRRCFLSRGAQRSGSAMDAALISARSEKLC